MIEVIFARRLLAISRHRDFPTEPTPRADIQSFEEREERNARAKLPCHFIILGFRITSTPSIFLEVVEVSFQ